MAEAPSPRPPGSPAGAWRFGFRFSPQVFVIMATAAALFGHAPVHGRRVVSLLCGGNLDLAALPQLLAQAAR